MDRISSLPDEIICHIGSFLSAKEAAFTMLLSKRWRNMFTIVQKLVYRSSNGGTSFTAFVDGVLALPASTRVRVFSVKCWLEDFEDLNRCLLDVLKRGVLELELLLHYGEEQGYSLPHQVFTCRTVAKLKLGYGFAIDILPANAFLPCLKRLSLHSVRFYDFGGACAFKTLLSASPVLEELVIDGVDWERWKWSWTVSSPTLERLKIRRREWESDADVENIVDVGGLAFDFDTISLDTPCLAYLDYSDYVPKEYLIVNLNSLVEAKLDLRVDENRVWDEIHADVFNPMNLINGLKNVQTLDLTTETMLMLSVFRDSLPMFENLLQVFVSLSNLCWDSLATLVKNSPNLKILVIDNPLHYASYDSREDRYICGCVSDYSFLLSSTLEILKINEYYGSLGELEQMRHILEKLSCLEFVEVRAQISGGNEKLQVIADLLMLPRASSKCKIQVKFS